MSTKTEFETELAVLPFHRRLANKIALMGGLSGVLLGSTTLVVAGWLGATSLGTAQQQRIAGDCDLLRASLSELLHTGGVEAMRAGLPQISEAFADLALVTVVDSAGTQVARWGRSGTGNGTTSQTLSLPGYVAQLEVHQATASGPVRRLWTVISMMLLGAIVLSLAGGWLLGRSMTGPLVAVASAAQALGRGRISGNRIDVNSSDEIAILAQSFNTMMESLQDLSRRAQAVAEGNLALEIDVRGDLANAFRAMVENLRHVVQQISVTTLQVNSATQQIAATAGQQERGAVQQSSAVEETRRTLVQLTDSGSRIASASQTVVDGAERTLQNNQLVGERTARLSEHIERIGEILETIKTIANKSDILALNAALEGTKAGKSGRGFSLVANQMQRLAENVMEAVRDIRQLTADIQEATTSTVLATEESIKLAADVTQAAREISLITRQQQTGVEQASSAMNDISGVAKSTAAGSSEISDAINDLLSLSRKLQAQVERFQINDAASGTLEVMRSTPADAMVS